MTTGRTDVEIHGHCDPQFQAVADAFAQNFRERGDNGASACVTLDGRVVVDLWGGWKDRDRTEAWEADTLVNVWSSTKGMAAVAGHLAADQGLLDFEAPVAHYWPEFAQAGKQDVPVKWLFTHQVGLVDFDGDHPDGVALDWHEVCRRLAATAPQWTPGAECGYHATTWGWLVGEVVRRAAGVASFGQYFRDQVARPLGADRDFYIGLPDAEHHRVARVFRAPEPDPAGEAPPPGNLGAVRGDPVAARSGILGMPKWSASPASAEWKRAEMPGMNGQGNARGLARVYAALANGGEAFGARIMSPASVERSARVEYEGPDRCLGVPVRRSLGFMLPASDLDTRPPEVFGHGGMGGSMGFADPVRRISFGYAMSLMAPAAGASGANDQRGQALAQAVYASIGEPL
ncbi:MAG: beta-lactamase family protein [Dehalococcoidia bacterium]|nr:beta-lactamase family protein [Dehalococcoidia bacterium]